MNFDFFNFAGVFVKPLNMAFSWLKELKINNVPLLNILLTFFFIASFLSFIFHFSVSPTAIGSKVHSIRAGREAKARRKNDDSNSDS